MKWFPVDSDAPNDPKVKAIIRKGLNGNPGQTAAGAMFLLWCYIANHGKGLPGEGIDLDGQPLPMDELADECLFERVNDCQDWLSGLAERRLIDPERWKAGVVYLPAMFNRAAAYAKSKGRAIPGTGGRKRAAAGDAGDGGGNLFPETPLQNNTIQHTTGSEPSSPDGDPGPGPDQVQALVELWNATRQPGPKVGKLTPDRKARYRRALADHPNLADWRTVIAWVNGQDWCNAKGTGQHPNWRMDLDYLVKPGKMAKALDQVRMDAVARPAANGRDARRGTTGHTNGFMAAVGAGDD